MTTELEKQLAEALRACLDYIPGSEVHNWPPGWRLQKIAIALGQEALSAYEQQKEKESNHVPY